MLLCYIYFDGAEIKDTTTTNFKVESVIINAVSSAKSLVLKLDAFGKSLI